MSVLSPIVDRWIQQGLIQGKDWTYFVQFKRAPIPLRVGKSVPCAENDTVLKTPHGTIFMILSAFTSPDCGIRWESYDIDTTNAWTPRRIMMAWDKPNIWGFVNNYGGISYFAGVPMRLYLVQPAMKEWAWTDWLRLHLFNDGSTDAYCLVYGFLGAKILLSKEQYYKRMGWSLE